MSTPKRKASWRKHAAKRTKSYRAWIGMRGRCNNPNNDAFMYYGGRGISVCASWDSYENFLADMGEPEKHLTLDRIDNDLGYSPHNCRWADRRMQSRNTRAAWLTERRAEIIRAICNDGPGCKIDLIAELCGKSRSTIGNALYSRAWAKKEAA